MSSLKKYSVTPDTSDQDVLPKAPDRTVDTGVYDAVIDLAYITKSQGGATGLRVHFKDPVGPFSLEDTFWIASGDAKGNRTYYVDANGDHKSLPGLVQADTLAQIVTGKHLSDLDTEEKMIKLYSYEAREEVPTKVEVVMDMVKKDLKLGVLKSRENKRARTDDGKWVDTAEEVFRNQIDKMFTADGRTLTEAKAGEEGKFIGRWKEKNQVDSPAGPRVVDRYKPVEGNSDTPAPAETKKDSKPLFT